jgi:polysaccharide chain length determinant protein (PEP-CTERM system associated)
MKDLKNCSAADYWRIIWHRKWYVITVFIVVNAGAVLYSWLKPEVYQSTSRIRVESAPIPQDYVRPSDRSSPEDQIAAIRSTVQSRSFLGRMIQDFQLFGYGVDADFSMEDAIKTVSGNIMITSTSKDTFNISCSTTDPQLSQALTRRMVETLIQSGSSSRKNRAIEADQFLEEQLRLTQQKLAEHEDKIKQFKLMHLGGLPEQEQANMNALSRMDVQLAATENALQQLQERKKLLSTVAQEQKRMLLLTQDLILPKQNSAAVVTEESNVSPALKAKQAELSALLAKYTPQYPDVVRLTREIEILKQKLAIEKDESAMGAGMAPIEDPKTQAQVEAPTETHIDLPEAGNLEIESVNNEIKRKEKERDAILDQIKKYQARLNLTPALEQELMALRREYETLNQQHASIQSKKFQTQMTASLENNMSGDTYKVIDGASLPEKPLFPNRIHIILMGLGAGFVLGIGAALGRELLDTTFGSGEEISTALNLPTLATIVEISQKQPKRLAGERSFSKSA